MTRAASPATTPRAARALGADCASRRASARSTGGCIPHGSGLLLRRPGMCPSPVCWGLGGLPSPEWDGTHRILPPLPPRQRLRLHAPQRLHHGPERVDAGATYRMARSHRVLHDGTETACSVYTMRQASGRVWRIGQTRPGTQVHGVAVNRQDLFTTKRRDRQGLLTTSPGSIDHPGRRYGHHRLHPQGREQRWPTGRCIAWRSGKSSAACSDCRRAAISSVQESSDFVSPAVSVGGCRGAGLASRHAVGPDVAADGVAGDPEQPGGCPHRESL